MAPAGRVPALLWPVFFVSGAAGLMYQVIWMRHATLQLGASNTAVGTIVATFLAGLALGSVLGGRWMDGQLEHRSPTFAATAYAVLEVGIAVWGLLFEPLLSLLSPLAGAFYGGGEAGLLFNGVRIAICVALVLPPTMAMGATLPILARFSASYADDPAQATGGLYAVNTLGAVVGAFGAGWVALPHLGLFGATAVAAALNLVVAAGAWGLSRSHAKPLEPEEDPDEAAPAPPWIFPLYAASGFAALVYEIAWTKGLILAFGTSVYAFSITLCFFIAGIAIGSALATRLGPRMDRTIAAFAFLQIATAILAAATVQLMQEMPVLMIAVAGARESSTAIRTAQIVIAGGILLPPTIMIGAMFPVLLRIAMGARAHAGRAVARLYAWNTGGNIAGTIAASFVLLPWIGIRGAMLVGAALNLLVAAAALSRMPDRRPWESPWVPLLLVPALLLVPPWDLAVVASAPVQYGRDYVTRSRMTGQPLDEMLRSQGKVVFSQWDAGGLVTVHDIPDMKGEVLRTLRINGKADASTGVDMITQVLISQVPLLLHAAPEDVLVVGVGSGATLSSALKHPVQRVDAVEISPAVIAGSRFFDETLGAPLDDPRVTLHVTDARAHVRFTQRRYDVIAAEPSNLWIRGMATLFTLENFAQYRARLKPGGIVCQWLHAYRLPAQDFAAVLRTFQAVFPDNALWEISVGRDYLLIGFTGPLPAWSTVQGRYRHPPVQEHLTRWGAPSLEAVMRGWIAGPEGFARVAGVARPITDDDTHVEYSAPLGLLATGRTSTLERLQEARELPAQQLEGGPDLTAFRRGRALLASAQLAEVEGNLLQQLMRVNRAAAQSGDDLAWAANANELSRHVYMATRQLLAAGRAGQALPFLEQVPPGTEFSDWAQQQADVIRASAAGTPVPASPPP